VKFMLIHHVDESVLDEAARACEADGTLLAWVNEMHDRGVLLDGGRLERSAGGGVVQRRDDNELLFSDGPFAETKEQVAGYDVLDCADLNEALALAASHPTVRFGAIEVRPFESFRPSARLRRVSWSGRLASP
jgi:hypothetical protein